MISEGAKKSKKDQLATLNDEQSRPMVALHLLKYLLGHEKYREAVLNNEDAAGLVKVLFNYVPLTQTRLNGEAGENLL